MVKLLANVVKFSKFLLNLACDFIAPNTCLSCGEMMKDNVNWSSKERENESKFDINNFICQKCITKFNTCCKIDQNFCCKKCGYPLLIDDEENENKNFLDKQKDENYCPSCQDKKLYFDVARSCFKYHYIVRRLLLNMKFYFQSDGLGLMGKSIFDVYKNHLKKADIVCFIPITKMKLFCKGYNHAGLIAGELYKQMRGQNGKELLLHDLLVKTKQTIGSKQLTQTERWQKQQRFSINTKYLSEEWKSKIDGKTILLIDDIMTTGATLNVASMVLKKDFPHSKIECLTFARTMLY